MVVPAQNTLEMTQIVQTDLEVEGKLTKDELYLNQVQRAAKENLALLKLFE